MKNGSLSHWLSGPLSPAAPQTQPLSGTMSVDVAIVGGGVSGLWTAWALAQADPSLEIAVLEARRLGFGASGRNGGLLSTKPVGQRRVLARGSRGNDGVRAAEAQLRLAMDEVVEILGAEAIHAHHGGWLQVARTPSELRRIENQFRASREWGLTEETVRLVSAGESADRIHVDGVLGALYSPENYSVDPARMVFELARQVLAAGVQVFTESPVTSIRPRLLGVGDLEVKARTVVVATEAYTVAQSGQKRQILPMNSAQIVTEPLTAEQWDLLGWAGYESLAGSAHTFFYSKRTEDDRIAIGGRGRPYRFGSGTDRAGEVDDATIRALEAVLAELFPQVRTRTAHAWCGVLGVARDWSPFVDLDRDAGILRMGGYTGQGLSAAHVAGRIAADLVLGRDGEYARSPWVRSAPRKWEPEPLRWLGATGLYRAYAWADRLEQRSGSSKTSVLARLADRIAGR